MNLVLDLLIFRLSIHQKKTTPNSLVKKTDYRLHSLQRRNRTKKFDLMIQILNKISNSKKKKKTTPNSTKKNKKMISNNMKKKNKSINRSGCRTISSNLSIKRILDLTLSSRYHLTDPSLKMM